MKRKSCRFDGKMWHKMPVLVLLILTGMATTARGQSPSPNPPSGKLIDAGGHLLHIHTMGKGKPVVVFENGSGDFSFIWDLVQPQVAKTTTTVSYDRAGYAWSEPGPLPRSGKQIAYELHTALHHAGIDGPYILVGQSYGGFLVRSFARFYKNEVAGIVLVDALNEDSRIIINNQPVRIRQWAKGLKAPAAQNKTRANTPPDTPQVVKLDTSIEPPLNKLPASDQKLWTWAQSQPQYRKAGGNEMNWSPEDVADMYEGKGKPEYMLGSIPLIVLARGSGDYSGLADSAALENERLLLQKDLSHLSSNSKLLFDQHSGHNIHLEDPAFVIDAIGQVVKAYKTGTRLE